MVAGARALAAPSDDTATPAPAEPGKSSDNLQEVVVTARKRSESILDVPSSITAISGESLALKADNSLTDIGAMVPQVSIDHASGGGNGAMITIRGVTAGATGDDSVEQDVTINIDGVPTSRGRIVEAAMFDLADVEVLKGPQALYYGKNSPAGVVSVNSQNPSDSFEGYVRAGYETTANEYSTEAAVSLPINDQLAVRLAFHGDDMLGGYFHDVGGPIAAAEAPAALSERGISLPGAATSELPATKDYYVRLTAVYKPTDRLDFNLKILGGNSHNDAGDDWDSVVWSCGPGLAHPVTVDLPSATAFSDPYGSCTRGRFQESKGDLPPQVAAHFADSNGGKPYSAMDTYLASLTANYRFDHVTVTSVTGYYNYTERAFDDFGETDYAILAGFNGDTNTTYTEELRATTSFDFPVNVTAGAFYEHDARNRTASNGFGYVGPDATTGQWQAFDALDGAWNNSYSAFADFNWEIRHDLDLTAGARYSIERNAADVGNTFVNSNFAPFGLTTPAGQRIYAAVKESNVSPAVTLSWHPTPDSTLYAAYKTGFKAGGISNPALEAVDSTPQSLEYGPEKVKGFEGGLKFKDSEINLSGDLDIYHYQFTGLQLSTFNSQLSTFFIQNAADSTVQGAEADLRWRPVRELTLNGAVGYNRARYDSFPAAECYDGQTVSQGCVNAGQNLSGRPLIRAPRWSYTLGLDWERSVTDRWMLGLTTDLKFSSGYYFSTTDAPFNYQSGFYLLDAGIHLSTSDKKWDLAVIGKNLTNRFYATSGFGLALSVPGAAQAEIGLPRTVLLQATFHF
jgi:iron complex outermembrane receptor protein